MLLVTENAVTGGEGALWLWGKEAVGLRVGREGV